MSNYTDLTAGTELITNSLGLVEILRTNWIAGLIITITVLILITRNMDKWAEFFLPITIMIGLTGIKISLLQYVIGGIIFAIRIMNSNTLGNFLDSTNIFKKSDLEKREQKARNKATGKLLSQGFTAKTLKQNQWNPFFKLEEIKDINRKK